MNLKILIFFQFSTFLVTKCAKSDDSYVSGTRFKSIECDANNITAVVKYCFIKAISRKVVTLNVGVKPLKSFKRPFYVQLILYYRYGLIYREVINTKKQEWCEIMDGKINNLYFAHTIAQIKASTPDLFHKCPYDTDVDIKNLTNDEKKAFDVFPEGIYKGSVLIFDKAAEPVFTLNITSQVKSPIKESMG